MPIDVPPIDLTGGFDPGMELPLAGCPAPGVRDAAAMWVFDETGAIGLPRFQVESVAPGEPGASAEFDGAEVAWETPMVALNAVLGDGTVFRTHELGDKHPTLGPDGKHSVLGAGPLHFRCDAPFDRWAASFRGAVTQTTTKSLMVAEPDHEPDGPRVHFAFDLEGTMAVPPWRQGVLQPQGEGGPGVNHPDEIAYEQWFRADGVVRIEGDERRIRGTGLRVRRQGIRRSTNSYNGGRGHCWQSALFPSGKAFGLDVNPPRPDGVPAFNDAYIFLGEGDLIPARVVKAPFMNQLMADNEDVSVVLESELGTTTIEGETALTFFGFRSFRSGFAFHQGGALYRWDGEEAYGMIERSAPTSAVRN